MRDLIEKRVPSGTSWYDALFVSGRSTPVSFKNSRLYSVSENSNSGFGFRLNRDRRTGFSFANSSDSVAGTIQRAAEMSVFGDEESFLLPEKTDVTFEAYSDAIKGFDLNSEITSAEKIIDDIKGIYPEASIDIGITSSEGGMRLLNSRGVDVSVRESYYGFSLSCTLVKPDGTRISVGDSRSELAPCDCSGLKNTVIEKIGAALTEESIETGTYPVIFPPQALGRLTGFIVSQLSGVPVWKGISPFAGRLGEKVFSENLTITDENFVEGSPFSTPFDSEGVTARRNFLVRNGVIETFINDLKYAERLGVEPTGNSSRGYSTLPSPAYHGVSLSPGKKSYAEIISGIRRGIIAEQFIGLGQSNTINGDFSANLDLAYLVKDGKIAGRVKDCMISGNIFDLMNGVFELSSEVERKGASLFPYAFFPSVNITV